MLKFKIARSYLAVQELIAEAYLRPVSETSFTENSF